MFKIDRRKRRFLTYEFNARMEEVQDAQKRITENLDRCAKIMGLLKAQMLQAQDDLSQALSHEQPQALSHEQQATQAYKTAVATFDQVWAMYKNTQQTS